MESVFLRCKTSCIGASQAPLSEPAQSQLRRSRAAIGSGGKKARPFWRRKKVSTGARTGDGISCPTKLRATLRAPPAKWAIKAFFPESPCRVLSLVLSFAPKESTAPLRTAVPPFAPESARHAPSRNFLNRIIAHHANRRLLRHSCCVLLQAGRPLALRVTEKSVCVPRKGKRLFRVRVSASAPAAA